jgi:hypothetical protein
MNAVLATKLNNLVENDVIKVYSIVKVEKFLMNVLGDKCVVIPLELEVVGTNMEKIGEPTDVINKDGAVAVALHEAQQHQQPHQHQQQYYIGEMGEPTFLHTPNKMIYAPLSNLPRWRPVKKATKAESSNCHLSPKQCGNTTGLTENAISRICCNKLDGSTPILQVIKMFDIHGCDWGQQCMIVSDGDRMMNAALDGEFDGGNPGIVQMYSIVKVKQFEVTNMWHPIANSCIPLWK